MLHLTKGFGVWRDVCCQVRHVSFTRSAAAMIVLVVTSEGSVYGSELGAIVDFCISHTSSATPSLYDQSLRLGTYSKPICTFRHKGRPVLSAHCSKG